MRSTLNIDLLFWLLIIILIIKWWCLVGHQGVCTRLTPAEVRIFMTHDLVCYSDHSTDTPPLCPHPPPLLQPRLVTMATTRTAPLSNHICPALHMEPMPPWNPKPSSSPSLYRSEPETFNLAQNPQPIQDPIPKTSWILTQNQIIFAHARTRNYWLYPEQNI